MHWGYSELGFPCSLSALGFCFADYHSVYSHISSFDVTTKDIRLQARMLSRITNHIETEVKKRTIQRAHMHIPHRHKDGLNQMCMLIVFGRPWGVNTSFVRPRFHALPYTFHLGAGVAILAQAIACQHLA